MSNEHELDTTTLKYVSNDLEHNANALERLANAGLVHDANVHGQVNSLRAMAFRYNRIATRIEANQKNNSPLKDVGKLVIAPEEYDQQRGGLYDPQGVEADAIATALGNAAMDSFEIVRVLRHADVAWRPLARNGARLPLHTTVVHVLTQLAGPGKRFLKSTSGQYSVNPRWKSTLGKAPPHAKRPHDFMSQAVTLVLGDKTLSTDEVLTRSLYLDAARKILGKRPTKPQIADTLSAGSRGSNPRFIRVKTGLYRNNPKYKKAK